MTVIIFSWLTDDFDQLGIDASGAVHTYDQPAGLWRPVEDKAWYLEAARQPLKKLADIIRAVES